MLIKHWPGRIILIAIPLIMSGCWDARDIDKLAFPIAAAYDIHEKKDHDYLADDVREEAIFDVTALKPNFQLQAKSKVTVQKLSASTISYVRDKRAFHDADDYEPGLNQTLIIGEDLARMGLENVLDSLLRVPRISNTMNFAVSEGRGEDILKTPIKNYNDMGIYLMGLLKDAQSKSFIPVATLHSIGINQAPGKNPVLPLLKKKGEDEVFISGAAVFNKCCLLAKLNPVETRSLVLLRGIKCNGRMPFFIEENGKIIQKGSAFVANKREVKVSRQGDKFNFLIKVDMYGSIVEFYSGEARKIKEADLKIVENSIAADLKRDCRQFLDKIQKELQLDCIDISKYALAKWRKELSDTIDNPEFIENADIELQVEVHLEDMGELNIIR